MKDKINPEHYFKGKLECIEITRHFDFCLGNVIKYIFRHEAKGGLEDLKKAQWYLNCEIKHYDKNSHL